MRKWKKQEKNKKQVRLNKDASGERAEDKIAEGDWPDLIGDFLVAHC